jgi:hypothetical protein
MKPTSTLEVAFVPSLFSAPSILLALSLLSAAPAVLPAQQVLDYDHSVLAAPPAYGYPLYTPGAGSLGQTVRTQFLCPESFLTAQSIGAGLVTHIGLSLAGEATYDTFVLRAGTSTVTALTNTWDQNLPDQRVQKDLSHVLLRGGGTATAPANQWVEFELEYPFFYVTGQSIVIDLTAHLAVPGALLGTTVGTAVERAFTLNYQGGPMANTLQAAGGLAFRLRFAPLDVVPYGSGCPGTGSFVPRLASLGRVQSREHELPARSRSRAAECVGRFPARLLPQHVRRRSIAVCVGRWLRAVDVRRNGGRRPQCWHCPRRWNGDPADVDPELAVADWRGLLRPICAAGCGFPGEGARGVQQCGRDRDLLGEGCWCADRLTQPRSPGAGK